MSAADPLEGSKPSRDCGGGVGHRLAGCRYRLQVTLEDAGSVHWMLSGASGVAPAAGERLAPQPLTALAAGDTDGQVVRAESYSTSPVPPAVRYGITVDMADGWRLFVACVL